MREGAGFEVVVVGAGAVGSSVAWHLTDRGVQTLLVDRYEAGTQTSPRAAGLCTAVSRDPDYAPFSQLSAQKLLSLEDELGVPVSVVQSGVLRLTREPAFIDDVRAEVQRGATQGIDVREISAAQAATLAPLIDPGAVLAVTHQDSEVYVRDPGDIGDAYRTVAARRGLTIESGVCVDGIEVVGGRVVAVTAGARRIAASVVILCANSGNARLASKVGIELPVFPMRHQLCITGPVSGCHPGWPQVKVVDGHVYLRPHGDRVLVGGFEPDPVTYTHSEADGQDMRALVLDPRPLERLIAGVADVFPTLGAAGISELRGGIVSMTADGRYILDKLPGLENAWLAGGDNASGNTTSPVAGQVMAEWIVDGNPSLDVDAFALDRLTGADEDAAAERALEQYVEMIALD